MEIVDLRTSPVKPVFFRYVSQNILGVVGMTAYFFADTYFISQACGADGLTALNLILPFFYFIYAVGDMLGTGSATRFTIERARNNSSAEFCFGNTVSYILLFGSISAVIGWFWSEELLRLCGADAAITALGGTYLRVILLAAGGFLFSQALGIFVRNDGAPRLVMVAMLTASLYNIIFDYILIFPVGWGFFGAAIATATAPLVGAAVCLTHFLSKHNTLRVHLNLSVSRLVDSAKLGTSAFVGEMSSCVTMVLFNFLFLAYAGNEGVAAYGVIANLATMASAVFTGLAQGSQPLASYYHGSRDYLKRKQVLWLSAITSVGLALIIVAVLGMFRAEVTAVFNRDNDLLLARYAETGILYYFPGFLFAGINVIGAGFLSAIEAAGWAGVISALRGFVLITGSALTLSKIFGLTGIWLAFPVSEGLTSLVVAYAMFNVLWEQK